MADFDTLDLIAKAKMRAKRPAVDEETSAQDWASLLNEAEAHVKGILSAHVPESQMGGLVLLELAGDRKSATFPAGVYPTGRVELYDGLAGRRLYPGSYDDPDADFVIEAAGVRAPMDRTLSFSGGLYARWTEGGSDIALNDAGASIGEPTLMPPHARILIVYEALSRWASMGGFRDPTYYENLFTNAAFDDPRTGKVGLVTQMKLQYHAQSAGGAARRMWWRSGDLGNLRHRMS